jgi:hypothetical protein
VAAFRSFDFFPATHSHKITNYREINLRVTGNYRDLTAK